MIFNSDVKLKGEVWRRIFDGLSNFFDQKMQKNYNIFVLCTAIGIMYDKQESIESSDEFFVPRLVLSQHNSDIDFLFQTAILVSSHTTFTRKERMKLAFDPNCDIEFKKMDFLVKFANYGASILASKIDVNDFSTMDKIYQFISNTYNDKNFDIYNQDFDDDLIDELIEQ